MTTYIAGHDGSDAARAALRFTVHLAEATGADVLAAGVYPHTRPMPARSASAAPLAELEAESRRRTEAQLGEIEHPRIVHCAVGAPSPAAGLQQLAEDQDASLIAVGATHHGALGRVRG